MLKEFKEFAMKGNMLDMAIGIIIGAAFATVITSAVGDILTPIISAVFNTPDFTNMFILLKEPENYSGPALTSIEAVREAGGVAIGYGLFIQALISFIIVAFVLFIIVKNVNKMKQAEEEAEAPAEPSAEETLLTEIRDLLARNKETS